MPLLGVDIFNSLADFIAKLGTYLTFDLILYIFLGLEALVLVFFSVRAQFSYEVSLLRSVDKINIYLNKVQYVNEKNLVEFNRMMKKVPHTLRYNWQQYMLFRDEKPSKYMSVYNCVEVPLKSSSYTASVKTLNYLSIIISSLGFIVACAYLSSFDITVAEFFYKAPIIPIVIMVFDVIFVMALRLRQASNLEDLYQTFNIFTLFIDKAVTTLPEYVDFEVLFTKKEIKKGIPVLNEYIEKRRLQEQEELRKARENAIDLEEYNFEGAEEKGELVLERAMRETELFLNLRQRLLTEIGQTESELEGYKKNFDNTSKEIQKKLQASKENIQRLREQQETSTNRIESNYIKKQLADEIKKQQQYEKDLNDATTRYKQESSGLIEEIEKKEKELEVGKANVEEAMLSEYKTFAGKVFREVNDEVEKKVAGEKEELIEARAKLRGDYERAMIQLEELRRENERLKEELLSGKDSLEVSEKSYAIAGTDNVQSEPVSQSESVDVTGEIQPSSETLATEGETQVDEYGGYYDDLGYYRYPNGTYYDPEGNFWDGNGGYFDPQGEYHMSDNTENSIKVTAGAEEESANLENNQAVQEIQPESLAADKSDATVSEEPKAEESQPATESSQDVTTSISDSTASEGDLITDSVKEPEESVEKPKKASVKKTAEKKQTETKKPAEKKTSTAKASSDKSAKTKTQASKTKKDQQAKTKKSDSAE